MIYQVLEDKMLDIQWMITTPEFDTFVANNAVHLTWLVACGNELDEDDKTRDRV